MPGVSPADGPVAVTGASGYIGSWIVHDLARQGYVVRACVRDLTSPGKVDHLLAMNDGNMMRGTVELFRGDLSEPGSYDAAFRGCCAVIHAGAAIGHNKETAQEIYDGCFTENVHVLDSVKKAGGAIKRFVFTSSFAAVGHPRPPGYIFTEKDWAGDNVEGYSGAWSQDNISKNGAIAYAMAKANTEKMIYEHASIDGSFEAVAILPIHVIGPLQCSNHETRGSWQTIVKQIAIGKPYPKAANLVGAYWSEGASSAAKGVHMLWNCVDVRDVASAHRLAIESSQVFNGSRYILSASDRRGEIFTWELPSRINALFPKMFPVRTNNADEHETTFAAPRAYCLLAKQQLGLITRSVDETIRDTVLSYIRLGLLGPESKL